MTKKLLSVILCLVIAFCAMPFAFAQEASASLTSVYGDGMLFEQNKEAILSGTASAGASIKAELFDSENALIASAENLTDENGTFSVSFISPAGSYEEYTIVLSADGVEFERLENVVFGELWLASGQSNMQYSLSDTPTGTQMQAENKKLSKWLRVFMVPPTPEYNGNSKLLPVDPQENIAGAQWIDGEDSAVYGMSGVAYFFAEDLMKDLDMPVGILNCSLGGSTIISWISREAIDNDSQVSALLKSKNFYFDRETWDESVRSIYYDMTGNFNMKVNAIRHFRPTGMIWYQGESDLMYKYKPEEYGAMFDLLQNSYSEIFGFEDTKMPVIYTQLAAYMYTKKGGFELPEWNAYYAEMQKKNPDSRAVITISDLPLTYRDYSGFIHPESKEPVGQRMSYAAQGLVYGADRDYTAPSVNSYEIKGRDIYITFDNVGDGLKVNGNKLIGFTISGANGIHVPAETEIINSNTVKVYSDSILKPISASYAYCVKNDRSNLYATDNGKLTMPVTPFVAGETDNPHYWVDKPWADCEEATVFQNYTNDFSGYGPTWESKNCEIDFNSDSAFSGENGLNIKSSENSFSVNNVMSFVDDLEIRRMREMDTDYSDYKTMSFRIKNNGENPITLVTVRFYSHSVTWYAAQNIETGTTDTVIPADGEWHTITLDLNSLYLTNAQNGLIYSNNMLDEVKEIRLVFTAEGDSDVSVDEFTFGIEGYDATLQYNQDFSFFGSISTFFRELWPSVVEWLSKIFETL